MTFELSEAELNNILTALQRFKEIESSKIFASIATIRTIWPECIGIGLFGSVARGTNHVNSDVDLLIALPKQIQITRELYTIWDTKIESLNLINNLSPHFVSCPNSLTEIGSIWLEFADYGITLWAKNDFLETVNNIKTNISTGMYERRKQIGTPAYWIKNN